MAQYLIIVILSKNFIMLLLFNVAFAFLERPQ